MTNAAAEAETPAVTEPENLRPAPGTSMLERWVEGDAEKAIRKIESLERVVERLRAASIRATYPSDWIIHTSTDSDGVILRQVGYLQDVGADRAGKLWGIEIQQPTEMREEFQDGSFTYRLTADAISKVTGERVENVLGSRWSGDKFFTRGLEEGDRVDPSDVAKAAYANLHGRAVRALAGLGGVSLDALQAAGLDVKKMVYVGYGKGTKGGQSTGAGVGGTDITVRFGQSKGTKVGDLADKDLAWYVKAYGENVEDPGKANFKKDNQRTLDALKAESERRKQATQHTADTGTEKKPSGAETDGAPTKGQRLSELRGRLLIALGKNERGLAPLLRELTKESDFPCNTLSDLADDHIDQISTIPEAELKATADEILRGLKK